MWRILPACLSAASSPHASSMLPAVGASKKRGQWICIRSIVVHAQPAQAALHLAPNRRRFEVVLHVAAAFGPDEAALGEDQRPARAEVSRARADDLLRVAQAVDRARCPPS